MHNIHPKIFFLKKAIDFEQHEPVIIILASKKVQVNIFQEVNFMLYQEIAKDVSMPMLGFGTFMNTR